MTNTRVLDSKAFREALLGLQSAVNRMIDIFESGEPTGENGNNANASAKADYQKAKPEVNEKPASVAQKDYYLGLVEKLNKLSEEQLSKPRYSQKQIENFFPKVEKSGKFANKAIKDLLKEIDQFEIAS